MVKLGTVDENELDRMTLGKSGAWVLEVNTLLLTTWEGKIEIEDTDDEDELDKTNCAFVAWEEIKPLLFTGREDKLTGLKTDEGNEFPWVNKANLTFEHLKLVHHYWLTEKLTNLDWMY